MMLRMIINKLKILFLLIGIYFVLSGPAYCQGRKFKASALVGINLAQIDGDLLYGFNKLGLSTGLRIAYPIHQKMDINMEMVYNQRGSNSGFGFGSQGDNFIDMKFIDLPFFVDYKDWYISGQNYYKVNVYTGLVTSYLFSVKSSNGLFSNDIDNYSRVGLSYLLGVGYKYSSRIGMTLRYTRSLTKLTTNPDGAIGYFITIAGEYMF